MNPLFEAFPYSPLSSEQTQAIMPFLILGIGTTISLVSASLKKGREWAYLTSLFTLIMAAIFVGMMPITVDLNVGGVLMITSQSVVMLMALLLAAFFGLLMLSGQDKRDHLLPEIYPLVMFAVTGMGLLVSSHHLLFQFIAIEIMSLAIYVLVAIRRTERSSAEAGMKYFILGGLASAMFLYGSALTYGSTGSFNLEVIASTPFSYLKLAGLSLIIVGLLFKVGAVPFHGWVPDVYQGASLPVTGFMAAAVKLAAFITLATVVGVALQDPTAKAPITWLITIVAAMTMAYGNFAALAQRSLKRLLAYSSIAHTGYLLVGVLAAGEISRSNGAPIALYLLFYVFSSMGAFACLQILMPGDEDGSIDSLAGRGLTHPMVGAAMTLFLFAMAGIPMTAGFIGKYLVFGAGVNAGHVPLVILAVLTSLAAAYYYLRIVVALYMQPVHEKAPRPALTFGAAIVVVICAMLTLNYGIRPTNLINAFESIWGAGQV